MEGLIALLFVGAVIGAWHLGWRDAEKALGKEPKAEREYMEGR